MLLLFGALFLYAATITYAIMACMIKQADRGGEVD